jgi:hypothetical protein
VTQSDFSYRWVDWSCPALLVVVEQGGTLVWTAHTQSHCATHQRSVYALRSSVLVLLALLLLLLCLQGPTKRMFYLPDIDSWDKWAAAGTDVQQVRSASRGLVEAGWLLIGSWSAHSMCSPAEAAVWRRRVLHGVWPRYSLLVCLECTHVLEAVETIPLACRVCPVC